jgi:hypothetical protein
MNARRWFPLLMFALLPCLVPAQALADDTSSGGPISFRLGGADFVPGGFFDMGAVYRSTASGAGLGSAFGVIPYSNTAAGNLSEVRFSAQLSRFDLRVTDAIGDTRLAAYGEADWAGNAAGSVWVNDNGQALRLRQLWASVAHGQWEFLAGQAWSWITPNREGLSSDANDLMLTRNLDDAMSVGLPWTRGAQFRAAFHPSEAIGIGVALENPEQYVGSGEVVFPAAFNGVLGGEFDGANNAATPNYQPDLVAKAAWDGLSGLGTIHLEAVGLARTFRATDAPGGGTKFEHHTANGSGYGGAATISLGERCRVVGSGLRGDGIGRYLGGLGPDVVVRPTGANPSFDLEIATVKAVSYLLGLEAELTEDDHVAAYFGRTDFDRNAFPDITVPGNPKPIIGFGGAGSPNSANRTLRELSVNASHAFWSSPEHGSFQLAGQYSRVTRMPFVVAPGAPYKALAEMFHVSVRYTLP